MSYYWFNGKILQKANEKYSKEKVVEYYLENKEAIKKSQGIKEYPRKRYQQLIQYKKEALQNK